MPDNEDKIYNKLEEMDKKFSWQLGGIEQHLSDLNGKVAKNRDEIDTTKKSLHKHLGSSSQKRSKNLTLYILAGAVVAILLLAVGILGGDINDAKDVVP